MLEARIQDSTSVYYNEVHSAQWVLKHISDPNSIYYTDLKNEFRVQFVIRSKPGKDTPDGIPYFRFYYSLEDYRKMNPDQASRYEYLIKQKHYQECPWHNIWKTRFEESNQLIEIEKYFVNKKGEKRRADIYIPYSNTVVEVEHSFKTESFEEKSGFYDEKGINIIWLFDLTSIYPEYDDCCDCRWLIPEDNRYAFFRLANKDNLYNYPVFVQLKDGYIYLIKDLGRVDTESINQSTIRWFCPLLRLKEEEFLQGVLQSNDVLYYSKKYLELNNRIIEYDNRLNQYNDTLKQNIDNDKKTKCDFDSNINNETLISKTISDHNTAKQIEPCELKLTSNDFKTIKRYENKQDQTYRKSVDSILAIKNRKITCIYCGFQGNTDYFWTYQGSTGICYKAECNKKHSQEISKVPLKNHEYVKNDVCPRCGGKLVVRDGRYGKFLGCENFPNCKYSETLI